MESGRPVLIYLKAYLLPTEICDLLEYLNSSSDLKA